MPSMWIVPGFSAARFGTLAAVSGSSRPSATAGIITGSSIMTTDRYCLSLFFCIFSRLTSEREPSNTTLQPNFFSTTGAMIGLDEALVAGGAADHEFLALGAQDARRRQGRGGSAGGCEDRAAVEDRRSLTCS